MYTVGINSDGFGSQYQAFMSGIAYCEYKKYTYIHTPIKILDPKRDGNVEEMNHFIGIPETPLSEEYNNKNIITELYSKLVHESLNPSIYYTDKVVKKIRDFYYSTEKPEINKVDIAIHIRRGDVSSQTFVDHFTSNEYYKKIIEFMKTKYPNYTITIFSEGDINDFMDLKDENVFFKLNTCIKETFHSLVKAKVLIMAKSSFSYTAAILNENEIYYQDFWHKALNHWNLLTNI